MAQALHHAPVASSLQALAAGWSVEGVASFPAATLPAVEVDAFADERAHLRARREPVRPEHIAYGAGPARGHLGATVEDEPPYEVGAGRREAAATTRAGEPGVAVGAGRADAMPRVLACLQAGPWASTNS